MSWRDEQARKSQEFYAYLTQIDKNCADTLGITVEELNNLDWETDPLQAKLQAAIDEAAYQQSRGRNEHF